MPWLAISAKLADQVGRPVNFAHDKPLGKSGLENFSIKSCCPSSDCHEALLHSFCIPNTSYPKYITTMDFIYLIPKATSPPPTRAVYQHSAKGSWFENIAVRSSGELLVTRIDAPEVWVINPQTGASSVLAAFDHDVKLRSAMGITELAPDIWAIGVGRYDHSDGGATDGSWEIWKLDLTGSRPLTSMLTRLPEAGMINGLTSWNENTVLAADSMHGKIFRIDAHSGAYSVALDDTATMAPPADAPVQIGINGIRVHNGYIYYTNTTLMSLFRIPVDEELRPRGPAQTQATGLVPDDFCFDSDDQNVLYVTGNVSNIVSKVKLSSDNPSLSAPETLVGDPLGLEMAGATACAFGRGPSDRRILYVVTCGGVAAPIKGETFEGAKVVAVDLSKD